MDISEVELIDVVITTKQAFLLYFLLLETT